MDWTSFIAELQEFGLSQPQIAAKCGCGQATISDLASGKTKEPRDSLGQALRSLMTECKRKRKTPSSRIKTQARDPEHAKASDLRDCLNRSYQAGLITDRRVSREPFDGPDRRRDGDRGGR